MMPSSATAARIFLRNLRIDTNNISNTDSNVAGDLISPNEVGGTPLIHVISPFHDKSSESFAPLNYEQWTTLVSIQTARDYFNNRNWDGLGEPSKPKAYQVVVLVCAVLLEDEEVLRGILEEYCDRIVVLPRSTKDVYPDKKMKSLPFVQDIIDAGKKVIEEGKMYYLMYTNSDVSIVCMFVERVFGSIVWASS